MRFLAKAAQLVNKFKKNGSSDGNQLMNTLKTAALKRLKFKIIGPIIISSVIVIVMFLVLSSMFGEKLSLLQMVDPNSGSSSYNCGGIGLYDEATLAQYHELSANAYETPNIPKDDLSSSEYGSVDNFNKHIKDTVCNAGYGTREGVVAAGMSLVGDYIKATGKRLRYDQGSRQYFDGGDNEGIINENFYLDCSSFAWWALYNGGFNIPCWPYTGSQYEWSDSNGYSRTPGPGVGQGGDYLVSNGHIILIVGNYDGGYYCAEESGWGTGAIISMRDYGGLGGYILIDMTEYYNNSANVRDNGGYCPAKSSKKSSKKSSSSSSSDSSSGKSLTPGFNLLNYSHPGGYTFDYWLNIPEGATEGSPLVIFLHGDGEVGSPDAVSGLAQVSYMRDTYKGTPFLFIAPVTNEQDWVQPPKPASLKGLIDKTVMDYKVNTNKIYIFGFSRGGTGVWKMVDLYPGFFAAAAPISNCPWEDMDASHFVPTRMKAISGTGGYDAQCIDCMNDMTDKIKAAGGDIERKIYEGVSHGEMSSTVDYDWLFEWMLGSGLNGNSQNC